MSRRPLWLALSFLPLAASVVGQRPGDIDPIARLDPARLEYEPKQGYLRSILAALKIDKDSQTLVFSKTSLQSGFITRATPRAIYFNDDTYVGWIPGAPMIEIATLHPTKGVVFYTIPNRKSASPAFAANPPECSRCHGGRASPLFANSVQTAPSGYPRVFEREYEATPALPIELRWGGWYVTGTHGAQRHLGNELSVGSEERHRIDVEKGANVTDLRRYFNPSRYLTPHSDIVALLVMEAQMEIQNAVVRAGQSGDVQGLVDALVGVEEAELSAPVVGTSGFAERYAKGAPKDRKGRSLAQLNLRSRLLRYGCSPLIYSQPFQSLPVATKKAAYARLRDLLSGVDPDFDRLTAVERRATLEILRDTLPDFPKA